MTVENILWSISTEECCWPGGSRTRNLLITSLMRIIHSWITHVHVNLVPISVTKRRPVYFTSTCSPNFVFWHSKSYSDIPNKAEYCIWHSKSYFDIRTETEYRILTFEILFWHSNWGGISYMYFDIRNPILRFDLKPNIVFWYSKSYFDIQTKVEYRILTFKMQFWHSNWSRMSNLTIEILS